MKWLFKSADNYLKESDWKDLALIKICLFAMGVFVGLQVPKKFKTPAAFAAFSASLATYVPIMTKYFKIVGRMIKNR